MITIDLGTLNNIVYYFVNPVIGFLTLAGLTSLWLINKKPPAVQIILKTIYLNLFFIVFKAVYSTIINYWAWSQSPTTSFFLEIPYLIKFSFNHYWLIPLITVFSAFIIYKTTKIINQRFEERFFYDQEPYLIALGIILSPWPWLIIFIVCVVLVLLVLQLINLILYWKNRYFKTALEDRIPMLFLWIPASLLSSFLHFAILLHAIPNYLILRYSLIKQFYDIFFLFK